MIKGSIFQNDETTNKNEAKPNPTVEKIELNTDFKPKRGEGDTFLLHFENFVSEQKVAFFSEKMDTSKSII